MTNSNIRQIDINDFKEIPSPVLYIDNDIVIVDNICVFADYQQEVKLDCFMIIFCEKGKIICNINGTPCLLNNEHCAVLPVGTTISPTEQDYSSDDFSIKVCAISKNLINEILCINKETFRILHYLYKNPILPVNKNVSYKQYLYKELLMTLIGEEEHVYSKHTRHYHIRGMLCEMMSGLSKLLPKEEKFEVGRGRASYIVQEFFMAVNADNANHRSVSYYADMLCYSPKYLSYIIKNAIGKSPLQIINENAIVQIKNKLKYTNMSIKEMSDFFNFPNASFFCKFFKLHTGCTPLKFRQQQNKVN